MLDFVYTLFHTVVIVVVKGVHSVDGAVGQKKRGLQLALFLSQGQRIFIRLLRIGIPHLPRILHGNGKLSGLGIHDKKKLIVLQNILLLAALEGVHLHDLRRLLFLPPEGDHQHADRDNGENQGGSYETLEPFGQCSLCVRLSYRFVLFHYVYLPAKLIPPCPSVGHLSRIPFKDVTIGI